MQDNTRCIDTLEGYRIDKEGVWHKEFETNNNPSLWQRLLKYFGLYKCAGDALTNYAINDLAVHTAGKYTYASVGTSAASSTDYTLNELVSPVMARQLATISYVSTYNTDPAYPDTVQYTIVITATESATLKEAGLHTTLTSGYMGSRQTFTDWVIASGESFAMVWKITYGRG
jgi:hypothetical protein